MARTVSKKFHFIEIDWIVYFPSKGNDGRSIQRYGVAFLDRNTGETQKGRKIYLEDVFSRPEITNRYPHTIRTYFESSGKKENFSPLYLEQHSTPNEEDLYTWIETQVSQSSKRL